MDVGHARVWTPELSVYVCSDFTRLGIDLGSMLPLTVRDEQKASDLDVIRDIQFRTRLGIWNVAHKDNTKQVEVGLYFLPP